MGRTSLACFVVLATTLCAGAEAQGTRELWIRHVTVVSPERSAPLENAMVIVRGGRIVSVSTSEPTDGPDNRPEIIEGQGLFLSPGLIDSHVHTNEVTGFGGSKEIEGRFPQVVRALREQMPRSYLYFGFTTLVDLISTPSHLREWNVTPVHPDLFFCGATPIPGGYPPIYKTQKEQARIFPYRVEAGKTPVQVVNAMKADGALCVKAFYERGFGETQVWPAPKLETIQAVVKAAHEAHMPVLIHANSTDGQEFALNAGVDIIAHGLWHWNGEPEATQLTPRAQGVLDRVLQANMGWQATLRVLGGDLDMFDPQFLDDPHVAAVVPPIALRWYRSKQGQWYHDADAGAFLLDMEDHAKAWEAIRSPEAHLIGPAVERGKSAARYMAAHHARLLFGSDTPGSASYANQPGLNGWLEMQLLKDAGLTPAEIFRAATLSNAEALGLTNELGTVQVGRRANLLLTREDPTRSIEAYDGIVRIILGGNVLERDEVVAEGKLSERSKETLSALSKHFSQARAMKPGSRPAPPELSLNNLLGLKLSSIRQALGAHDRLEEQLGPVECPTKQCLEYTYGPLKTPEPEEPIERNGTKEIEVTTGGPWLLIVGLSDGLVTWADWRGQK